MKKKGAFHVKVIYILMNLLGCSQFFTSCPPTKEILQENYLIKLNSGLKLIPDRRFFIDSFHLMVVAGGLLLTVQRQALCHKKL
jgi:hypothetical protein